MRLKMVPGSPENIDVGGIATVIRKYLLHLPAHGVEVTNGENDAYDVELVHAGFSPFTSPRAANVAALHGLYWTGDIPALSPPHHFINVRIAKAIMRAAVVTVPSKWVADSLRRAFHINPFVVPHGVDVDDWSGGQDGGYILWAKNTSSFVCDPAPVVALSKMMPDLRFVSTFGQQSANLRSPNRPFRPDEMRQQMLNCSVYLATTQETFGIATLEAMAAGKPVVGYKTGFQPVIHGVTGWLVEPGDVQGLASGVRWALANREMLSDNARRIAGRYTWDRACEALIEALQAAERVRHAERGIAVVIPYYRKGEVALTRAIDSVIEQTVSEAPRIVVVDDCSDDNVAAAVCKRYPKRVRYMKTSTRSGVATARNIGIESVKAEFVTCLDADDMLAPEYLETCYRRLAYDRGIGIAYTGLGEAVDGHLKPSGWPGEFNFWQQAAGQNCIHTAAMFRREMWRRVGGFRPRFTRYERVGCGSEDAAFWLHGTALGYEAVRVTPAPLFIYTPGGATARQGYAEIPWHTEFGWHKHGYPAGAPTKPGIMSWPVYAYDRKFVSVIIPVGPGHEVYAQDALDSVVSQTYRKTEIIVVWDSPSPIPERYKSGYPFVRFVTTEGPGSGAGAARNKGARLATTPFLVFLDADDMLAEDFIAECIAAWRETKAIIHTDFIGVHDIPEGADPKRLKGYIGHDTLGGIAYNNNRVYDFDREKALDPQLPGNDPYVWSLVTCFLPKKWFLAVGGFKEDLEAWEDWDLHLRLARGGYPYSHVQKYLLYYRQSIGKRATAAQTQWREWNLYERVG